MIMEKYLLDTNVVISLLRKDEKVIDKIKSVRFSNCYISEITIAELYFGASKSERYEEQSKDVDLVSSCFKIVPIFESLALYGQLRWYLQQKGTPVGDFDILIGSTAIYKGYTMVTANVKHFAMLPHIKLENLQF